MVNKLDEHKVLMEIYHPYIFEHPQSSDYFRPSY